MTGERVRSERRGAVYVLLAASLLLVATVIGGGGPGGGALLHTLLATVAAVLAAVVGTLALVRFYSRRRTVHLFVGTGFLGAAVLDTYHTVATFPGLFPADSFEAGLPYTWSWAASRLFLAFYLCLSWLAWRSDERIEREEWRKKVTPVYASAAVLIVLIFILLATGAPGTAYRPDLFVPRPGELLPGLLLLVALAGYVQKGDWRADHFDHWLVVALIIAVVVQVAILPFSVEPQDRAVLLARLLTAGSYAAVFTGLLASVHVTFLREEESAAAIRKANEALAREVAVRREAERVLQENEERLQDFLDHANDLIQSTDPEGRILYVNDAWQRTLGYGEGEVGSLNILELVDPDSRPSFKRVMEKVFRGEAVSEFRVTFRARDGSKVICSGSSNCRFENGRPVASRSILRNVTDEVRTEQELARSQANVRALFESTGDAIWAVDRAQRLLTFNSAYALTVEAVTGRAPSVGDSLEEAVGPKAVEWFQECYDRALAGNRFSAIREETLGGEVRTYELFFNPIEGEGEASGVVVFSKDVSRRRRMEEALRAAKRESEEASQAKSEFLANMSHELRTPLNSVIGFANILLKDPNERLGKKEAGYLERILANGKHLLQIINEILDLSKIEAGRMELELEDVDLTELARETVAQLEGQVGGKPVELRAGWDGEPAPAHTDRGKLKQVLINLVGNALKFTEEGSVSVKIETEGDGRTPARIRVRDTGVGIPQDRLKAIFEAFQQADAGTTRRFGGTGLGLAISRSLCTLMGYELGVESELGTGSTFTIHLGPPPKVRGEAVEGGKGEDVGKEVAAGEAAEGAEGTEGRGLWGRTVLVVDDEEDSRTLLAHTLEELGCKVLLAKDGREGVAAARKARPDLITVDLMMPRMDGWEVLKALKEDPDLREIPVVVVSMAARDGKGQVLGAVDVLEKPVDREALLGVLRRTLARDTGRVLIVDDDPDARELVSRCVEEAGLVADAVESGEKALEFLGEKEVDLILLDLLMPGIDGFATLERIRSLPERSTVPVVVLTSKDLTSKEEQLLHEQTNQVILKGDDVESRLQGVLEGFFGVAERES